MFWAEIWEYIKIFIWKLSVFGGEIFNTFEKAYFRNERSDRRIETKRTSNEESDQPAHPRSVIRVFVIRMKKLCIFSYTKMRPVKILIRLSECAG